MTENKTNCYNKWYLKTFRDLMAINGKFTMKQVFMIALLNSPNHYRKSDIIELAYSVMDDAKDAGIVKAVDKDEWVSIFSKEFNNFANQQDYDEDTFNI